MTRADKISKAVEELRGLGVPDKALEQVEKWRDQDRKCASCGKLIFESHGRWLHAETNFAECDIDIPHARPMKNADGSEATF